MMNLFFRVLLSIFFATVSGFSAQSGQERVDPVRVPIEQIHYDHRACLTDLVGYHEIKDRLGELELRLSQQSNHELMLFTAYTEISEAQVNLAYVLQVGSDEAVKCTLRRLLAKNYKGLCLFNQKISEFSHTGMDPMAARQFLQELRQQGVLTHLGTLESLLGN